MGHAWVVGECCTLSGDGLWRAGGDLMTFLMPLTAIRSMWGPSPSCVPMQLFLPWPQPPLQAAKPVLQGGRAVSPPRHWLTRSVDWR